MAIPSTLANGKTTWINDSENVLQNYTNPQLGKMARFIKTFIPPLFRAIENSKPKVVFEIDCGSGEPSLRILSWKNGKIVMSKKVEVQWGDLNKDLGASMRDGERGFIAELINTYPKAIFDIRATAWARLEENDKDYKNKNVGERLVWLNSLNQAPNDINQLPTAARNVRFRVISQPEEAEGADISLKEMLKSDPDFARGFDPNAQPIDPARAKSVDGGNRSVQGADIAVEFGGANVKEWIQANGVVGAIQECRARFDAAFKHDSATVPVAGQEDVPFFAGSHLFALTKNETVLKKLNIPYEMKADRKGKYAPALTGNEWHRGVDATAVLKALDETIAEQTTNYESSNADTKTAALNDLYGLIVTSELLRQYVTKRDTKLVRVGEYKKAGEDVKMTHYLGGYIKDYVVPFFQSPKNWFVRRGEQFLRFIARKIDV